MKILVTGSCGQLGYEVVSEALDRGYTVIASDLRNADFGAFSAMDITDEANVRDAICSSGAETVIHCAAWTAVDDAEAPELRDNVSAVNYMGTVNVAKACREIGAKLIYISTDYVFGGSGSQPHRADDMDFAPINEYGRSKLAGEQAVREILDRYFIVRTSWLFGRGRNFVTTMINAGQKYESVRVVSDQIGTPTYAADLAKLLVDMVETEEYGCYNGVNSGGYISWYDFCLEIYSRAGMTTKVIPVATAEYGESRARRPLNSRLDTSKLEASGFKPLPDWRNALERYLRSIDALWDM